MLSTQYQQTLHTKPFFYHRPQASSEPVPARKGMRLGLAQRRLALSEVLVLLMRVIPAGHRAPAMLHMQVVDCTRQASAQARLEELSDCNRTVPPPLASHADEEVLLFGESLVQVGDGALQFPHDLAEVRVASRLQLCLAAYPATSSARVMQHLTIGDKVHSALDLLSLRLAPAK